MVQVIRVIENILTAFGTEYKINVPVYTGILTWSQVNLKYSVVWSISSHQISSVCFVHLMQIYVMYNVHID